MNRRNRPDEVCELIKKRVPGTLTWVPRAGETFDIGLRSAKPSHTESDSERISYEFEPYLQSLREELYFQPLQDMGGIEAYFQWAGFRGDLVLHVIETTEDFQEVIREFFVDFSQLSFPAQRPSWPHRYLCIRVRADAFRHVLREGLSWDEFTVGFQARFSREPNTYNAGFWHHFTQKLPQEPPVLASYRRRS